MLHTVVGLASLAFLPHPTRVTNGASRVVALTTERQHAIVASTRAPSPRCALLDSLMRRGTEEDRTAEIENAFFSVSENDERIAGYRTRAERISALEDTIEALSDDDLAAKTVEFRQRLEQGATVDEILEEAFAVVREGAWRTLELRHYDVQLVGALALHEGYLAQMGTGEGKTLVATCAVYLNALSREGALLITANDYLARRDAETMGQVYRFLGLSVGLVQQGQPTNQRRDAYACDVTCALAAAPVAADNAASTTPPVPRTPALAARVARWRARTSHHSPLRDTV